MLEESALASHLSRRRRAGGEVVVRTIAAETGTVVEDAKGRPRDRVEVWVEARRGRARGR